jgi:hypothetical protein
VSTPSPKKKKVSKKDKHKSKKDLKKKDKRKSRKDDDTKQKGNVVLTSKDDDSDSDESEVEIVNQQKLKNVEYSKTPQASTKATLSLTAASTGSKFSQGQASTFSTEY